MISGHNIYCIYVTGEMIETEDFLTILVYILTDSKPWVKKVVSSV